MVNQTGRPRSERMGKKGNAAAQQLGFVGFSSSQPVFIGVHPAQLVRMEFGPQYVRVVYIDVVTSMRISIT